jgi:hypothetical protein
MKTGIETNKRLQCLKPVLKKWITLNGEFSKRWKHWSDAPWWYGERANISVFAGATWQAKGLAFEEYAALKRGEKEDYSGRIDLEFYVGKYRFLAEAKQCWPTVRRGASYIHSFVKKTKKDIQKCRPDGYSRLAIVFGSPKIKGKLNLVERHEKIHEIIVQAKKVEHDAIAWVFPKLKKFPHDKDWVYPGIIVWIKEVRR